MNKYKLMVQINDYAYGMWFEVLSYNDCNVRIYDHLTIDYVDLDIDDKMRFWVIEVTK